MFEVSCPNCRRKLLVAEADAGAASECPACHVTFKPDLCDKPSRPDEHVTEQAPYRPPGWDPDDEGYLPPLQLPPPPSQTERVWNRLKQLFRWTFVAGCGLAGLVMLALIRREPDEFLPNLLLVPVAGALMAFNVCGLYWLHASRGPDWPTWPGYVSFGVQGVTFVALLLAMLIDERHGKFTGIFSALIGSWLAAFFSSVVLLMIGLTLSRLFKLTNSHGAATKASRRRPDDGLYGDDFDE